MNGPHIFPKIPEGSTNRDYYIFEKFPDGSAFWRACVFGREDVELKLLEFSQGSGNEFFALGGPTVCRNPNEIIQHDRTSHSSSEACSQERIPPI